MDPELKFRALFSDAYPSLRRYAHYRGLSGADADDLIADVFAVAWQRLPDVPDDPVPWLIAVARNIWRNGLRADRRRADIVRRLHPAAPLPPPEPDDDAGVAALRTAFRSLAPQDQEILRLVAWDGLSPTQIGVALGLSAGAARVRVHRARRRLRAMLPEEAVTTGGPQTHIQRTNDSKETK